MKWLQFIELFDTDHVRIPVDHPNWLWCGTASVWWRDQGDTSSWIHISCSELVIHLEPMQRRRLTVFQSINLPQSTIYMFNAQRTSGSYIEYPSFLKLKHQILTSCVTVCRLFLKSSMPWQVLPSKPADSQIQTNILHMKSPYTILNELSYHILLTIRWFSHLNKLDDSAFMFSLSVLLLESFSTISFAQNTTSLKWKRLSIGKVHQSFHILELHPLFIKTTWFILIEVHGKE